MARKAKEVELPALEELEALADEINDVLNPTEPIKYSKKTTAEELVEMIKEQAEGNIYEIDFQPDPDYDTVVIFSEEAEATINALGIEILKGAPPPPEKEKEKEEEKKPAKGAKKEEPKKEEKKSAPAKKDEKKAALAKKDEKKAASAKKKAEKEEPTYTRSGAFVDAVKKGGTKAEIVALSDKLYVENGGSSNLTVAEALYRYAMPSLKLLDVVTEKDGKIKLAK